jgi:hypothetical protein
MDFNKFIRPGLALILSGCFGHAQADWAQSVSPLIIGALPSEMQTQPQNPPTFSWARHPAKPASYIVEVRKGTTVVASYSTNRNWYLPSASLPVGQYTWRVRGEGRSDWSDDRAFVISATSADFTVPENPTLRARILSRSRPRGLQAMPVYANWTLAMKVERGSAVTQLIKEVDWNITTTNLPVIDDSRWPLDTTSMATSAQAVQVADIRQQLDKRGRQLESAALLYRLTGTGKYLTEALRRGDELASFNPLGPTNYAKQDQAPLIIATALARAFDTLGTDVDASRRTRWMASVRAYGGQIYADLARDNARSDEYPFDSHAIGNTAGLAMISMLALGEVEEATAWFDFSLRSYISSLSPWSGPEGGFANGSAYGEYAVALYQRVWQPVLQATGVNLYNKPWAKGFLYFFMHFVPPGAQSHVFGDGHEVVPLQSVMKGYATNFALPGAAWYANSLQGQHDALTLLYSPYPLPSSTVTASAPGTPYLVLPSIGWSAMHSNLRDLTRTSVYFKSSPFGSYNHSHGDQNTFVLMKGGVPLLGEGGYYDYYGSPLWKTYYRTTKAHNGITFDDGVGQKTDGDNESQLNLDGKITAFSGSTELDFVEGDATKAYGGALTSAVRKLWYLRTMDAVVVHDRLASATARSYEWNMHAFAPIVAGSNNSLSVTNGGYSVCIRPISTGHHVETRTGLPQMSGRTETQAVLVKDAKALTAEFLVVLDVGCKNPAITLSTTSTGRILKVGTQSIVLPR